MFFLGQSFPPAGRRGNSAAGERVYGKVDFFTFKIRLLFIYLLVIHEGKLNFAGLAKKK